MATYKDPLSRVKIASPCSADWNRMFGDERKRFCGQCELNVYNLSDMTKREAEDLITRMEGKLCVRFFRRADGTIITQDCPVGLRAVKQRMLRIATATISTVMAFLSGCGLYSAASRTAQQPVLMGEIQLQERVVNEEPPYVEMMGGMSLPEQGAPFIADPPVQVTKGSKSKRARNENK